MESGIHFYACVEWIWCVRGRCLFTLSICGTLWVVRCTNTALGRAAAGLEHCVPMDILSSVQWGPCRGDFDTACGQRIRLLLTFFSLRLNSMPPLRCWSRSSNFPEFAGRCLNAFTSHHSCLSPWPPSAVLSFPTSSPSDDTGPPHSHLAGAEGCGRTFTRLNGPAWLPQSTPGMQQPPTRLI